MTFIFSSSKPTTSSSGAKPMQTTATLDDFTPFHAMVCSPNTASRCIQSFNGAVLFMPSSYNASTIQNFDCSATLNLISYYLLVLVSLTGLSTLLRVTKYRETKEFDKDHLEEISDKWVSKYNSRLHVEEHVLDYCKKHTNSQTLYLKRHFEFQFQLFGLDVVMLHFVCDQNKLHLVEVYHFQHRLLQNLMATLISFFGRLVRNLLRAGGENQQSVDSQPKNKKEQ